MARRVSVRASSCRPKRKSCPVAGNGLGKKQRAPLLLYFPVDPKALRTPFRARVLQFIHDSARQEPGRIRLLLSIWANIDRHEWKAVDKALSKAVFEQEAAWTEDERADCLRTIDFEILPLKI